MSDESLGSIQWCRFGNGNARWPGFEPHETDWVIYIDGDEADRVLACGEIEPTIGRAISTTMAASGH